MAEGDFPSVEVRGALRTAWTMSESYQTFKRSRRIETPKINKDGTIGKRPSVRYKCDQCGEETQEATANGVNKRGKPKRKLLMYIDHIKPVVDPEIGFQDWDNYWSRLYVAQENWDSGLQVLCRYCHKVKTKLETDERKLHGTLKRDRPNS